MKQNRAKNKILKLKQDIKQAFGAPIDFDDGKGAYRRLEQVAEKASSSSNRIHYDDLIPAQELSLIHVGATFTRNNPELYFLAETKEPYILLKEQKEARRQREAEDAATGRPRNILTTTFARELSRIELHDPVNVITRRTRLDLLLNYVFHNAAPYFSDRLTLQTELEFTYGPVEFDGDNYAYYGIPYYSLWYGPVEDLATNFVVVHTETPGFFDEALIHAYMGMIYKARKGCGKKNCEVFGLATDSNEFWFYHLDSQGNWSHTHYWASKPEFGYCYEDYEDIAHLLVFIFNEAYTLSIENDTSGKMERSKLEVKRLQHQGTEETW